MVAAIKKAVGDTTWNQFFHKILGYIIYGVITMVAFYINTNGRLDALEVGQKKSVSYETMMLYLTLKDKEIELIKESQKKCEEIQLKSREELDNELKEIKNQINDLQLKYAIISRGSSKTSITKAGINGIKE